MANGVYTIYIYLNNSVDAPPSKPIGLMVISNPISHAVKLVWNSNKEPDLSSYEISREIVSKGNKWEVIGNTKETSFIDNSVYYISYRGAVIYRIRAIDKQNLYSIYSDIEAMNIEPYLKITEAIEINSIKEYEIKQNFPNPFNPTTTIKYSIPEKSLVTIKVYDILGKEIMTLINEEEPPGNYQVEFNATNLHSGVYFYRIKAGSFNQVRKMLLIK